MRDTLLPLSRPTIGEEEIAAVVATLRSGWLTTGERVRRFEEAWTRRTGASHAVAVSSCTAGLHVALAALELEPGDECILPSLTWPSTANAVVLAGGKPVFAEVDERTLCLDPADVERRVGPRTRAILPVHFAGLPADLERLRGTAERAGAALVEDAAHAAGALHRGRPIGAESQVAVLSFHPVKSMTTGEGGVILTRESELARRSRLLAWHGVDKDPWARHSGTGGHSARYDVLCPGWKYNLTDLAAAIGLAQLERLDGLVARRAALARLYDQTLAERVPELVRPAWPERPDDRHAWVIYPVRLREGAGLDRDALMTRLREQNIQTGLHFEAVHLASWYRRTWGHGPGDLPVTERVSSSILSLPLFPAMEDRDVDDVVAALRKVLDATRS